jgi:beta-1,2-mannobiose phosphorylase / 1,2-beta-oligomannan phosphorylase
MRGTPAPEKTHDFRLLRLDEVTFACSEELAGMYKLSPCVWRENGRFELLLRVVNYSDDPSAKVARIHHGSSTDGLHFTLDETPAIPAGPDVLGSYDSGGCEDPTVATVDGTYYVYYSGWNEHVKRGELLLAAGPDVHHLQKQGIALESSERAANPKEATIVQAPDGSWRLFFEYAHENRSKIGLARGAHVAGPWEVLNPLFDARPETWDSWHLSTGPILDTNPEFPVMFYNGATANAQWRIGWVIFDAAYTRVVARSTLPIVLPHIKRNFDDSDIAFAASVIEVDGAIHLYYSVADQYVTRAIVRRV